MNKLLDDFTSVFGGRFVYNEPGPGIIYLAKNDIPYVIPDTGLELMISESISSSKNLIIEKCAVLEYIPGLVY